MIRPSTKFNKMAASVHTLDLLNLENSTGHSLFVNREMLKNKMRLWLRSLHLAAFPSDLLLLDSLFVPYTGAERFHFGLN